MKKFITIGISVALLVLALTGCGCNHEWSEATCTEPSTCSKCGETNGSPEGHTTDEGYCYRCKEYIGVIKLDDDMIDEIEKYAKDDMSSLLVSIKLVYGLDMDFRTSCIDTMFQCDDYTYEVVYRDKKNNNRACIEFMEDDNHEITWHYEDY